VFENGHFDDKRLGKAGGGCGSLGNLQHALALTLFIFF
jgi:hypothetical protein